MPTPTPAPAPSPAPSPASSHTREGSVSLYLPCTFPFPPLPPQLAHGAPSAFRGCGLAVGRPVLRAAPVGGRSWPAPSLAPACLLAAMPRPHSLVMLSPSFWCALLAQFPRVLSWRFAFTGLHLHIILCTVIRWRAGLRGDSRSFALCLSLVPILWALCFPPPSSPSSPLPRPLS